MARPETTTFSHSTTTTSIGGVASSVVSRSSSNGATKEQIQRGDEVKTEFSAREGSYKISSLIDNLGKLGTSTCLSEPVKITLITRVQTVPETNSETNSRRSSSTTNNYIHHPLAPLDNNSGDNQNEQRSSISNGIESSQHNGSVLLTEILAFNVGRELIIYEFAEATQPNFGEPIDHRIYKQNHQPTCHDITQRTNNNVLHILVGFSKGQIQYINMQTKEQKVFNEGSYLDKSKVTCIKWLPSPKTYFVASYSSGYLYVFDEQLNYQRDANMPPTYSTIKDDEKNFSISYTKNKSKQARNPVSRWAIGSGSINEFAFSPDHILLGVVSQDGFLRVFNYEKMELVAYMKSYFGGLLCLCWSPDGKYVATGGEDDFITLFSIDPSEHAPRVLCRGHGHTSWINSISFDPYMNAKTYYSCSLQTTPSSSNGDDDNDSSRIPWSRSDSSCFDTTIPTLFYRIGSVGQDNRLCLWDITEDILKVNKNQPNGKRNSSLYPISSITPSTSNGYSSFLSDTTTLISTNTPITTTKSSFSSLTSRLSFVRNSNKVNKSTDDNPDGTGQTLANGSSKKARKLSVLSNTPSGSKSATSSSSKMAAVAAAAAGASNDLGQTSSLSSSTSTTNSLSRRTNFDLARTTFGTNLCPKLDDIQVIEPAVTEFISHERLTGIYFGENCILTASQDGIIGIWEKPQKLLTSTMKSTKIIPSLLSCQALKDLLRSPPRQISVLEADIGKQFEREFQLGHLPQARYFDQLECTTPTKLIPRGLPDVKCFEEYLSRLGVSNKDHIVLYDRSPMGFYASSRAWWLFKTYGVDSLSILNGGFYKWLKEINEIESSNESNTKKNETKKFTVNLNEEMLQKYDDILTNVSSETESAKRVQIIDARPPNLFYGANAGHMPNALNLPYTSVLDQTNQTLKSNDDLTQIFNKAGVDISKPAIYTCQTGTTASTLAFAAHVLGQKKPSVYMGSFTEWQERAPTDLIIKGNGKSIGG